MALDAYLPPLSHLVSFGRPLQAAIPVLHRMAFWWLVPPGWEPDFVSLAPLSYNLSCLAAEVRLDLQSASLAPGQISAQHVHTIAICNEFIDEVAWIWALDLAADPAFHQTWTSLSRPTPVGTSWLPLRCSSWQ
ncbi:hypothetical protein DSO57_1000629 [Entomophthora muscae]|uniref:Uncharacterized protein n=1 Tax=Entomophthora muscae TaxID=34485 RepID=A0ACC2S064_9FUNG|nr:hypothetical protein DSO57_1000629 [Entomophthora muscae]